MGELGGGGFAATEKAMIKRLALASVFALSTLVGIPQTATAAATTGGCGLNCVYVTVIDGFGNVLYGYWECPEQMECVEP